MQAQPNQGALSLVTICSNFCTVKAVRSCLYSTYLCRNCAQHQSSIWDQFIDYGQTSTLQNPVFVLEVNVMSAPRPSMFDTCLQSLSKTFPQGDAPHTGDAAHCEVAVVNSSGMKISMGAIWRLSLDVSAELHALFVIPDAMSVARPSTCDPSEYQK